MEKDKVQSDDACQKRSRNKTQSSITATSSTAAVTTTTTSTISSQNSSNSTVVKVGSPVNTVNGSTLMEEARSSRNSSYSITSLLSEDRSTTKRCSPEANSPSHYSGATTRPQYCSPTPPSEDGWYSESVDRLRSIELSVSIFDASKVN